MNLISGSFARFNQLSNYLTSIFLIITLDQFNQKIIESKVYILLSIVIGIMIMISGARVSLVLYLLIMLYYVLRFAGKKPVFFIVVFLCVIWSNNFLGRNGTFSGNEADSGSGFERNIAGISNVVNSDDISEESTLSLSLFLLIEKFDNPLLGNGGSRRPNNIYDVNEQFSEKIYRVDAGLAFAIVEYGIIGFCLFLFLFYTVFKYISLNKSIQTPLMALLYFLLLTVTEEGIFDISMLLFYYVYALTKKNENKKVILKRI